MNLEVQFLPDHHGHDRDHRVHAHVHDHELHLNNSLFSTIMVESSGGRSARHSVATSTLNLIPSPFRFHPSTSTSTVTVHHPYTPHNYHNVTT
jgi:hypothetical protein